MGKLKEEGPSLYESDDTFAYIAGYTSGGAPCGVTWEEWERIEREDSQSKTRIDDDYPMDEDNWESLLIYIDDLTDKDIPF